MLIDLGTIKEDPTLPTKVSRGAGSVCVCGTEGGASGGRSPRSTIDALLPRPPP